MTQTQDEQNVATPAQNTNAETPVAEATTSQPVAESVTENNVAPATESSVNNGSNLQDD